MQKSVPHKGQGGGRGQANGRQRLLIMYLACHGGFCAGVPNQWHGNGIEARPGAVLSSNLMST